MDTARLETLLKPLNPWVLGWYECAGKVSRLYAKELLVEHLLVSHVLDTDERAACADAIVETLLSYASHEAGILRDEARRIGIPVSDCPGEVWAKLEEISDFYENVLRTQNVGRIVETTEGLHAAAARPTRRCSI